MRSTFVRIYAACGILLLLSLDTSAETLSIQSADVQSYFAADSKTFLTSQRSDPVVLAPWPTSGVGPYGILGPLGVPTTPTVPPAPANLGPANSFAISPVTSLFLDVPTNTTSKSVVMANAAPGTLGATTPLGTVTYSWLQTGPGTRPRSR